MDPNELRERRMQYFASQATQKSQTLPSEEEDLFADEVQDGQEDVSPDPVENAHLVEVPHPVEVSDQVKVHDEAVPSSTQPGHSNKPAQNIVVNFFNFSGPSSNAVSLSPVKRFLAALGAPVPTPPTFSLPDVDTTRDPEKRDNHSVEETVPSVSSDDDPASKADDIPTVDLTKEEGNVFKEFDGYNAETDHDSDSQHVSDDDLDDDFVPSTSKFKLPPARTPSKSRSLSLSKPKTAPTVQDELRSLLKSIGSKSQSAGSSSSTLSSPSSGGSSKSGLSSSALSMLSMPSCNSMGESSSSSSGLSPSTSAFSKNTPSSCEPSTKETVHLPPGYACSVCLENPFQVKLRCGHVFCEECVLRIMAQNRPHKCPVCKKNFRVYEKIFTG